MAVSPDTGVTLMAHTIAPEYRRKVTAFLKLSGQLVDRFERLAPGEDGNIDAADRRLIKIFRAKRDELLSRETYASRSKCFACEKPVGAKSHLAFTPDGQSVYVGRECYNLIESAGDRGWQPPKGGPRLYTLSANPERENSETETR
jgi:hypothetical protein